MENIYINKYKKVDQSLNSIQKESNKIIGKGVDISLSNLSYEEQNLVLTIIRHNAELNNEADATFSLLEYLELKFDNNPELIKNNLNKVMSSTDNIEFRKKINNLITQIDVHYKNIPSTGDEDIDKMRQSLNYPLKTKKPNKIIDKLYDVRQFLFDKVVDPLKQKFSPIKIDTSEFDDLNRQELVRMYKSDKFYDLTEEQQMALYQATVLEYCKANNVKPIPIKARNLDKNTNGEYVVSSHKISINQDLLDKIRNARKTKDQYCAYKILSTLIHESRHGYQFTEMLKHPKNERENYVKHNYSLFPCNNLDKYLSLPEELDARCASLEYLKEAALNCSPAEKDSLIKFYNQQKETEMNNRKRPVKPSVQKHFNEIFNGTILTRGLKSSQNQQKPQQIIKREVSLSM